MEICPLPKYEKYVTYLLVEHVLFVVVESMLSAFIEHLGVLVEHMLSFIEITPVTYFWRIQILSVIQKPSS